MKILNRSKWVFNLRQFFCFFCDCFLRYFPLKDKWHAHPRLRLPQSGPVLGFRVEPGWVGLELTGHMGFLGLWSSRKWNWPCDNVNNICRIYWRLMGWAGPALKNNHSFYFFLLFFIFFENLKFKLPRSSLFTTGGSKFIFCCCSYRRLPNLTNLPYYLNSRIRQVLRFVFSCHLGLRV